MLWDEEDGFYYDRKKNKDLPIARSRWEGALLNMRSAGQWKIPVRSAAAFTTIWADVATASQANAMVTRYLTNPREFWVPYPVSALPRSEIGYTTRIQPGDVGRNWRANTWIRVNYMIYHGLRSYGYPGIAASLAQRTLELAAKAGNREFYNSENGVGAGQNPFRGSSLLVHFLMLEETLDWDITEINTDPQ
jgi:neutral trehalase